jgi:voltage-gated potassium channel
VARSIKDAQMRRELGAVVLAVRKANGEMLFNPLAETVSAAGDYLIVMGPPQHLQHLEELSAEQAASRENKSQTSMYSEPDSRVTWLRW